VGEFGFRGLRGGRVLAVREPNDSGDGEVVGRVAPHVGDVARRDADVHPVLGGLLDDAFDVRGGRRRAENGVVDARGERVAVHAVLNSIFR